MATQDFRKIKPQTHLIQTREVAIKELEEKIWRIVKDEYPKDAINALSKVITKLT